MEHRHGIGMRIKKKRIMDFEQFLFDMSSFRHSIVLPSSPKVCDHPLESPLPLMSPALSSALQPQATSGNLLLPYNGYWKQQNDCESDHGTNTSSTLNTAPEAIEILRQCKKETTLHKNELHDTSTSTNNSNEESSDENNFSEHEVNNYTSTSYFKSSEVFRMARYLVGKQKFSFLLEEFILERNHSHGTCADFFSFLERNVRDRVLQQDLEQCHRWLHHVGHVHVSVSVLPFSLSPVSPLPSVSSPSPYSCLLSSTSFPSLSSLSFRSRSCPLSSPHLGYLSSLKNVCVAVPSRKEWEKMSSLCGCCSAEEVSGAVSSLASLLTLLSSPCLLLSFRQNSSPSLIIPCDMGLVFSSNKKVISTFSFVLRRETQFLILPLAQLPSSITTFLHFPSLSFLSSLSSLSSPLLTSIPVPSPPKEEFFPVFFRHYSSFVSFHTTVEQWNGPKTLPVSCTMERNLEWNFSQIERVLKCEEDSISIYQAVQSFCQISISLIYQYLSLLSHSSLLSLLSFRSLSSSIFSSTPLSTQSPYSDLLSVETLLSVSCVDLKAVAGLCQQLRKERAWEQLAPASIISALKILTKRKVFSPLEMCYFLSVPAETKLSLILAHPGYFPFSPLMSLDKSTPVSLTSPLSPLSSNSLKTRLCPVVLHMSHVLFTHYWSEELKDSFVATKRYVRKSMELKGYTGEEREIIWRDCSQKEILDIDERNFDDKKLLRLLDFYLLIGPKNDALLKEIHQNFAFASKNWNYIYDSIKNFALTGHQVEFWNAINIWFPEIHAAVLQVDEKSVETQDIELLLLHGCKKAREEEQSKSLREKEHNKKGGEKDCTKKRGEIKQEKEKNASIEEKKTKFFYYVKLVAMIKFIPTERYFLHLEKCILHPWFDFTSPSLVNGLVKKLTSNYFFFHHASGRGYSFLTTLIYHLTKHQMIDLAAEYVKYFIPWEFLRNPQQNLMRQSLILIQKMN